MNLELIKAWHQRACPVPTQEDFSVQLGCHFEEISEMVRALTFHVDGHDVVGEGTQLDLMLTAVAEDLKSGRTKVSAHDRVGFADALGDQIVTAVGAGYRASINVPEATRIINKSNWSKFDDAGYPIFNAYGKVIKGPNYISPDLTRCV